MRYQNNHEGRAEAKTFYDLWLSHFIFCLQSPADRPKILKRFKKNLNNWLIIYCKVREKLKLDCKDPTVFSRLWNQMHDFENGKLNGSLRVQHLLLLLRQVCKHK